MARLKPWKELIPVFLIASFIGLLSLVHLLVNLIRKGPTQLFFVKKRNVRPDVLENNEYGSHEFIRLKNTRMKIHCVVGGAKGKPLMLFVHGFPEFWYSWRRQLKEFSKDFRTVAMDMRGYGESDKPTGISNYTMDKLLNDIDELIPALGYKSCTLVAHDWGGVIAWYFASLHPEKVDRLVICNAPHALAMRKHLYSAFSQFMKSWYTFFFQLPVLPIVNLRFSDLHWLELSLTGERMGAKPGTFTSEDMEAYKYTFSEYEDLCGPINYYRASRRYDSVSLPKTKIIVPTLIIWGTNDGALEKKIAELSSSYCESCSIQYIEGASHWVQQEEPGRVNSLIRDFLRN